MNMMYSSQTQTEWCYMLNTPNRPPCDPWPLEFSTLSRLERLVVMGPCNKSEESSILHFTILVGDLCVPSYYHSESPQFSKSSKFSHTFMYVEECPDSMTSTMFEV